MQYVLGTNPVSAEPGSLLTTARAGTNVTFTFTARQATGASYTGLARYYDVETTADLATPTSWTGLTGYTNIAGNDQTVTVTAPISGTGRYYRLKVRLQ